MSNIAYILRNIRIQDIVDIIIVAALISILLSWFKQRPTRLVLIGISVVALIYGIARFLQLYLTTLIFQGFFAIFLFVLVVIFQEDLKRFFERLGLIGQMGKKISQTTPYATVAEAITSAVSNMAEKNVGALIVISGNDPLGRHISGGIPLNGLVSHSLLESIFDPHSSGHDGAVIIEGDRVSTFGCHLPLASQGEQSKNLGLRHTAALGLAERTDALCIVVSEKKGTISIARGETLEEITNLTDLKQIIESHLIEKFVHRKPFADTLWKQNIKEKFIALVLASFLWVLFGYQKETIFKDYTLYLNFVNIPPQFVLEEPPASEVKIGLMGPPQAFQLLTPEHLKVSLDLSHLKEGTNVIGLSKDIVRLPSNLSIVTISPSSIKITASRLITDTARVEVAKKNSPPRGVKITSIKVDPSHVRVIMPRFMRERNLKITTTPIDLAKITETVVLNVPLKLPPHVSLVDGSPSSVSVKVYVKKRPK
ncbi:MAG: diadenylate cyclase [Syntrophales bacterium]|nr:diadenylate cyclase [Syntrophales bacterium]